MRRAWAFSQSMLASALTRCRVGQRLFICRLTCWLRQEGSKRSGASSTGQEGQIQPADVSKFSSSRWHSFREKKLCSSKEKPFNKTLCCCSFAFVFMGSTVFYHQEQICETGNNKKDRRVDKFSRGCQQHLFIITYDCLTFWTLLSSAGSHKLSWNHQTSHVFISAKVENKEVGVWVILLPVTPRQEAWPLWGWHAKIRIKQNPHMLQCCPSRSGPSGWTQTWSFWAASHSCSPATLTSM